MTERKDFDAAAALWDEEPRRVKLAADIAAAMRELLPLSSEWRGMDFGCGTGLLTLHLAPWLGSVVGADSSPGMLEQLNAKLHRSSITNVRSALCDHEHGVLPDGPFDLIASAMTLHHIPEIAPLLAALHERLSPGGWLALADLEAEDGSFHGDATGVFHLGFSRACLNELLEEAGFCERSVRVAADVVKGERSYPVLLAVGRRAP